MMVFDLDKKRELKRLRQEGVDALIFVLFMFGILQNHASKCTNALVYDVSLVWLIIIFFIIYVMARERFKP